MDVFLSRSDETLYLERRLFNGWSQLVQVIARFVVIFGIITTSDISKLLYVISRAVRRVKFETILKYHEWYLHQISRKNHAIICLYYYTQKVCNFHMQVFQIKLKYLCSKPIRLQKFLMQQYNKNDKIAFTHSKVTTTSISPYLRHLNGTFFASSVSHEMLTEHYNVQETIHVLKSNVP